MNFFRAISLSLLLTHVAAAFSLFPEVTNVAVAVTTNREVARGIAFDGTNFLVVFQGDNLYASANPTNQLAAQLLSPDGALIGARVDLQLNGSIPLVAVGSSSYLMVWAETAGAPPGIYGQLLDRSGAKQATSFLIASNTSVDEISGIVFAHGQFCIVWAVTNVATNTALIQLQRVSPSGDLTGTVLFVGATSSANQQFPHVDQGATDFLLTWVAQRSDTNVWDVLGRSIDLAGNISTEFHISQTPAAAPYPVASAFDGTNHLVAWSRESGPNKQFYAGNDTNGVPFSTNVLFPMLFGRVVGASSSNNEFQISRARWGQVSPTVAFDGTNFLVSWNDLRYSGFSHYRETPTVWWQTSGSKKFTPFFQFISPAGSLLDTEFIAGGYGPFDYTAGARTGPVLAFGSGHGALLCNRSFQESRESDEVRVIGLLPPDRQPARLIPNGITNGILNLKIVGSRNVDYIVFATTNLSVWPSASNSVGLGPAQNRFTYLNYTEPRVDVPLSFPRLFFRAVDGVEYCKSNLRRMTWATEQWGLDNDKLPFQWATTTELKVYAPEEWICPNAGYYRLGNLGSHYTTAVPNCTVAHHVQP